MVRLLARPGLLLAGALSLAACGGTPPKPKGAVDVPEKALFERDVDPTDLFPADLDLVVRVDVGRMRAGIGPAAADALAKRALREGGEPELKQALACAEVVWIAARAEVGRALDEGDHVIVVEGKQCQPELSASRWQRVRSTNGKLRIFDRRGDAEPPRAGTARILNLGNRAAAFVSPVELDAVRRVIAEGPDAKRGNPTAEGLLSFDVRAGRLPPALDKKYPSIGAVLAGVARVRGSATLGDDGVRIDVQVLGASQAGAARAARFLEALRDSLVKSPRYAAVLGAVTVEQVERTVQVRLTLPPHAVLALLAAGPEDDKEEAPPGGPVPASSPEGPSPAGR